MKPGKNDQNPPLDNQGDDKQKDAPREFEYETPHEQPDVKSKK